MTKKKLAKKPKTKKTKAKNKFQDFRIELTLKEKLKNSEKKKHSKSIRITSSLDQVKKTFKESYKNRDKEELVLSVYEVNPESGRSKRTPILSKKIFPTKTIRYADIINQFDLQNDFDTFSEEYLPLFKYFLKVKEIDEVHEVKFKKETSHPYWQEHPQVEYEVKIARGHKEINILRSEWQEWIYQDLKNKIVEAITDPSTNAEEFKTLLENSGYFSKTLVEDDKIEVYRDVSDEIENPTDVYDQWAAPIIIKDKKTGAEIKMDANQLDGLIDSARAQLGM